MKKIYYLKTCSTCQRILKLFDKHLKNFELQNIKVDKITDYELNDLIERAGSITQLFSKRSQNYKKLGLKDKILTDNEMMELILSDYTFLKRPIIIDYNNIFIGSDKSNLLELQHHFDKTN